VAALAHHRARRALIVVGEGPLRGTARGGRGAIQGLADRVTFTGAIAERQLIRSLRGARSPSCFPPLDEDYGYVTLEAFPGAEGR